MTPHPTAAQALSMQFGGQGAAIESSPEGVLAQILLPHLWGSQTERLLVLGSDCIRRVSGAYEIIGNSSEIAGLAISPIGRDLEETSYRLYADLFAILKTSGQHMYRLWHYVPDINGTTDGLENYRIFNVGRRKAFDDHFGGRAESFMPAASAVGTTGNHLIMAFVGGTQAPRFVENPRQTPAYHYPSDYGPKTPSFARAAIAGNQVYISGTASICGHESRAAGDLLGQLAVTAENLKTLVQSLGQANWREVSTKPGFYLKVYLRHAADLEALLPHLQSTLHASEANTMILEADICRADLDLEIEAAFQLT